MRGRSNFILLCQLNLRITRWLSTSLAYLCIRFDLKNVVDQHSSLYWNMGNLFSWTVRVTLLGSYITSAVLFLTDCTLHQTGHWLVLFWFKGWRGLWKHIVSRGKFHFYSCLTLIQKSSNLFKYDAPTIWKLSHKDTRLSWWC